MGFLQRLFGKSETMPRAVTSADDPGDAPRSPEADWLPGSHPEMGGDAIATREEAELVSREQVERGASGAGGFAPSPGPAPEYIPEAGQPTEQEWAEEERRYKEREDRPPGA